MDPIDEFDDVMRSLDQLIQDLTAINDAAPLEDGEERHLVAVWTRGREASVG